MDNNIDYDAILSELDIAAEKKQEIALAKANAEINTINKVRTAYYDGGYDAIRETKNSAIKAEKTKVPPHKTPVNAKALLRARLCTGE